MSSSLREIIWTDTGMRTKGFGVDWANNTFYHKEYQHILGEPIAQKGMLKHITGVQFTCGLVCCSVLSVGGLVTHFSHLHTPNMGFTQPNPAQWSCTRPFSTIKVPVQQPLSELHLAGTGLTKNNLKTETWFSFLKILHFLSVILGGFHSGINKFFRDFQAPREWWWPKSSLCAPNGSIFSNSWLQSLREIWFPWEHWVKNWEAVGHLQK